MRYTIEGDNLPVVICYLNDGEQMLTEKGAMSWMTPNMEMKTSMTGGLGKAFGRAFSGESMFMNYYTCRGGEGMIAFASSFPGRILPVPIGPGTGIIVQKTAFLAAEAGVEPGDVILAADGQPIRDNWELLDFRRTVHVGDTVDLTILRDGQEIHCYVTLTATM